jgi:hypothetical protein
MFAKDRSLFYQAITLLHSNDPESEKKLLTMLQQSSNKSEISIGKFFPF